MANIQLLPSNATYAEASQIIPTLNLVIGGINGINAAIAPVFTANGTVATAMSSLGPTGSHTTIQKWLTVTDTTGALFYAPLF